MMIIELQVMPVGCSVMFQVLTHTNNLLRSLIPLTHADDFSLLAGQEKLLFYFLDFRKPWLTLDNSKEQYYIRYEGRYLKELGKSLDTLTKMAVTQAATETLKYTVLNSEF